LGNRILEDTKTVQNTIKWLANLAILLDISLEIFFMKKHKKAKEDVISKRQIYCSSSKETI